MSISRTRPATVRLLLLATLAAIAGVFAEVRNGSGTATDFAEPGVEIDGRATPAPGIDSAAERARVAAHLERVEAELRRRDVSRLSDAQQAARARQLEILREYRLAGVFPLNHDFPGERVPYFVDAHGTLCAMAYLIARSGATDMVQRVAAAKNNARIAELASDPELIAWLEAAGLTAEEAGMIQPTYDWQPVEPQEVSTVSTGYAVATVASTGLGVASVVLNAQVRNAPERWAGAVGVASGGFALGLGAAQIGSSGDTQKFAIWNAAVGALVTTMGVRTLIAAGSQRTARVGAAAEGVKLEALPLVGADGAAGMSVRLSF